MESSSAVPGTALFFARAACLLRRRNTGEFRPQDAPMAGRPTP
jgi:hypothetical protein